MTETDPIKDMENKFKLSLIQIEKRFVDLEATVGELLQKVKDLDAESMKELRERIDSLENLIMVEQAGIIELKKALESYSSEREIPYDIRERLAKIEEKLASLDATALEAKIKNIADLFNANLNLKWKEIQKNINLAEERLRSLPEEVLEEMKKVKIESIEKVAEELSDLRAAARHLEEFKIIKNKIIESMANLHKEVEKSKSEFKLMVDGLKSIRNEFELKLYTERADFGKRFEEMERRLDDIKAFFDILNLRIDEIVDKIIQIETKISAIEKTRIEKLEREPHPIVIE